MVYVPIAKLDNFTSKEDNMQLWLNDIEKAITVNGWNDTQVLQAIPYFLRDTTDAWYQSLAVKSQTFNDFKTEFIRYFSNNNSINKLANLFTTIKQEDTEVVTTYLECFHRNLYQIQAIQTDYFTAPQILNQFIRNLHIDLPTAVTHARNFEAANESINQKLEEYLANNRAIYQTPQQRHNSGNMNCFQNQSRPLSLTAPSLPSELCSWNSETGTTQHLNSQNYLSLLVIPENATPNNQELRQTSTSNIPPATIMEDKSLDAIFSFELEELSTMPLFSRATLKKKPITAMYTDVKIDGHPIKLIFDSGSAGSIITQQLMDQLGC
ncbi:hypothetical protein G9A89_008906 [Geosiphon pyriformis]|nr:hypothetical protein G9A89_008906 [Geosiphon pyriformis]